MNTTSSQRQWLTELRKLTSAAGDACIVEGHPMYESERALFNRYHDLHPGAIVQLRGADSVPTIVRFAAANGILLAIRGGGHHIAGYGSCDGGIVLDFRNCRNVTIAPNGVASVSPGCRLCDVDQTLNNLGRVIPTGTVSQTGIAGLALSGGIGWLLGSYGLTCDHIVGADVVTADGSTLRAEDLDHSDLLWALRGGGGNFGVVTQFRFRTHALPPVTVGSATVTSRFAQGVLERLALYLADDCPPELTVAAQLSLSENSDPTLAVEFCLTGTNDNSLRRLAAALLPGVFSMNRGARFQDWQKSLDHLTEQPLRGYWKARYSDYLTPMDISLMIDALRDARTRLDARARPSILIEHLHGAFRDFDETSSAFPLRAARFGVLFSSRWPDPSCDLESTSWVRRSFDTLDPAERSMTYSNYSLGDDQRALSSFGGRIASRLQRVKQIYDPENVFRRNHNIAKESPVQSYTTEANAEVSK